MNKAWIILVLVVIIFSQLLILSAFHEVDDNGVVIGSSVIMISKWNYVSANVELSITPAAVNGMTGPVELLLPNGTTHNISPSGFSMNVQLPRTGDSFANGAISDPFSLSQDHPLNVYINQNVQNVTDYVSSLQSSASGSLIGSGLEVQLYIVIIYGDAQVTVSGYGVAL